MIRFVIFCSPTSIFRDSSWNLNFPVTFQKILSKKKKKKKSIGLEFFLLHFVDLPCLIYHISDSATLLLACPSLHCYYCCLQFLICSAWYWSVTSALALRELWTYFHVTSKNISYSNIYGNVILCLLKLIRKLSVYKLFTQSLLFTPGFLLITICLNKIYYAE